MHRTASEWRIVPSPRQQRLDALLLLVPPLLLSWIFPWLLTSLPPLLWWCLYRLRRQSTYRIGVDAQGWWLDIHGVRRHVRWRSGSHRRRHHLRLVWGFWPWQELSVHADSVADADAFRRLKASLYGSV